MKANPIITGRLVWFPILIRYFKNICKRLIVFLEHKQILCCRFRKLHSTAMALIKTTDNIKRLLDKRNYVIMIFIDFEKAFDTVDHEIILKKKCVLVSEGIQICSSDHIWLIEASLVLWMEYNLIQALWNMKYLRVSSGSIIFLTIHERYIQSSLMQCC